MRRGFIDPSKVAAFWDEARQGAAEHKQTGYLQDAWPAALGHNRFAGEWRDVSAWLDAIGAARGACLDVGCGVGLWLERLATRFDHVDGIDVSAEMVASAAARLARAGIANASVATKSATDIVGDARYDVVFVGGVLMYLNDEDVEGMVARLARLLRPGGVLILRESTSSPATWYRDAPLSPGLFGDPTAPRPPYYAIYRTPPTYGEMAERQGLVPLRRQPNRHYKLADLTESWLRLLDRLTGGRLRRRPASAERAARWLHAVRHLTLVPQYHLIRLFAPRSFKLDNWWYVYRAPLVPAANPPPA